MDKTKRIIHSDILSLLYRHGRLNLVTMERSNDSVVVNDKVLVTCEVLKSATPGCIVAAFVKIYDLSGKEIKMFHYAAISECVKWINDYVNDDKKEK